MAIKVKRRILVAKFLEKATNFWSNFCTMKEVFFFCYHFFCYYIGSRRIWALLMDDQIYVNVREKENFQL